MQVHLSSTRRNLTGIIIIPGSQVYLAFIKWYAPAPCIDQQPGFLTDNFRNTYAAAADAEVTAIKLLL